MAIFCGVDVGDAGFEAVGKFFAACFASAVFLFGDFLGVVSGLLRWVFGGGLGLSQADGVEEVGVAGEVEFFAFVAEELAVEPVDLLLELEDAFTLL